MFDLIAKVLAWFYELWPSYGMAIVLLTVVVMVVLTPLTMKGTRSMIKMQHLQPEMKKIQTRYKNDRERMNKEMMAFYQANKINPMGGCIPLFAQAPVFIVLYNVLRGLTRRRSDVGEVAGWVTARMSAGQDLVGAPQTARPFYPDYLPEDSLLFQDLSHETEMVSWGFDLSHSLSHALSISLFTAFPYLVLVLAVFATSWVMNKQIRGRNKNQSSNRQQEMIMKVMPFFLPIISFGLDAALVSYFVVSNLYRTGQQFYITRTLYGPGQEAPAVVVPAPIQEPEDKPSSGKGGRSGKGGPSGSEGRRAGGSVGVSDEARSRRTSAGGSGTGGQGEKKPTKPLEPESVEQEGPINRGRRDKRGRTGGSSGVFGRRARRQRRSEESEASDGRPPAARHGGGRTTTPGTARTPGANRKKKKRKKRK